VTYNVKTKRVLSQINVTPLVDVMLVILIIFMVAAPMIQEGIDVNLPKVEASAIKADKEPLILTIDKQGRIRINKNRIKLSDLEKKLKAISSRKKVEMILLKADKDVSYGYVVKTITKVRKAGIQKIGMVTEPLQGKK
jgi:biopolymer transport protein TolR